MAFSAGNASCLLGAKVNVLGFRVQSLNRSIKVDVQKIITLPSKQKGSLRGDQPSRPRRVPYALQQGALATGGQKAGAHEGTKEGALPLQHSPDTFYEWTPARVHRATSPMPSQPVAA